MIHRSAGRLRLAIGMLGMVILTACAATTVPQTTPSAGGEATIPPPPSATPSPTASPIPTLEATTAPPTPTRDPSLPDVPYQMTGYEMLAAQIGAASYSGYTCLITPAGCACELPLIQQVTFTFNADGTLSYRFEGEGYAATWPMQRVGPNQWEYALSIRSEQRDETIGEARALITFTETGYIFTQMVDYFDSGLVACPDVHFRRLASSD